MIIKDGVKNAFRRKSKDPHSLASSQTPSAVIQIDGCSSPSESSSTFAPISRENTFGPTYGTSKALHPGRNVDHSSLEKSTDSTIKEGGPRRRLQEQVSRESSSGRGAGGSSREFVPHYKPEQDVSSGPWVANDQVEALKLDFSYMQSEEYIRSSHNIARMESSEAMAMRHNGLKSPISSVFEDGYAPQSSTVSKINASDSQRSAASKPRPAKMSHESIPPNGGNLIRSAKSYVMESPEPRTSGMTRSTRSYLHKPSEVQFHTRMIAPIDAMSAILDNSGSLGSRSTVRFSMSDVDTMSRSKNIGDVPCANTLKLPPCTHHPRKTSSPVHRIMSSSR
ncbi:hypothetical protein BC829DRAFT_380819 [Chytridium lagenaria]|nr:hypothetical protein BC829DRAFT_380819 [Chytridium lagenaria]